MNSNEILVGRQVGKDDFLVDEQYKSVGRKHARIIRKPDGIYIEDMDSIHGTFVNGKSVKLKKVNLADHIFLGGLDYFKLELGKVLSKLPISDEDFKKGFLRLKQVYDNFQTESTRLQTKGQESMMTKRMLPTMIMGVITATFTAIFREYAVVIGILGSVTTIGVFLLATKMASKSTKDMKVKSAKLNEEFELEYVCPACGGSLKGKSWEFLKRQGKCQFCRREWKVD
jgi:pSer/pThr/pTyr-binding forkhead associated (FHA) protein